jgi:hypothetical protein
MLNSKLFSIEVLMLDINGTEIFWMLSSIYPGEVEKIANIDC